MLAKNSGFEARSKIRVFVELLGRLSRQAMADTFLVHLDKGASIAELLNKLEEDGKISISDKKSILILVNGQSMGADAKLKDLDKVTITPIVFGGSSFARAIERFVYCLSVKNI